MKDIYNEMHEERYVFIIIFIFEIYLCSEILITKFL